MTQPEEEKKTFRERLDDLSELVQQLESGALSLEESIVKFEAGKALQKSLLEELASYEKRLEKLLDTDGDAGAAG